MSTPNLPPPDDEDDDEPAERSTLGKIAHGCLMVVVTALVAIFLVFGLCVITLNYM